ncbi:MAG: RNA degradosome polyphosphate kinase [Clostridia bacterium]|nr:RNA degradosome polyphosphate kinase [Clostridia bacterium]
MAPDKKKFYYNRELSWMDFNARVLEEAQKKDNPIMERLRFLAITGSNLDEFFMVRVAGVSNQVNAGYTKPDASGLTPKELLNELDKKTHAFMEKQYSCLYRSILPMLKKQADIEFITPDKMTDAQKRHIDAYFHQVLFPVLTPLAVDSSRPFPMLANKSLNLAVRLTSKDDPGEKCFAVVQVPAILPRFTELPKIGETRCFVLLEDIITAYLEELFELHEIKAVCPFRITRNSDLTIDEEADDFMYEIEKSIKRRKRGRPVRLELIQHADKDTRKFLMKTMEIGDSEVYEVPGPLDLTFFSKFANLPGCDHLCFAPIRPTTPAGDFWGYTDIFEAIRDGDRLVHHPYETFDHVVQFIAQAAEDENVLAIKQTLYRVSGNSPIIASLIKAAENGKQVTVLVELKARFDEENNINWARKLEKAGCHVIYGLTGLKTHCKIALVVRREEDGIRRYLHLGTGNYNDSTAKIYTDLGLFTCNAQYGSDASSLFNVITGYSRPPEYKHFIVAPHGMRSFFVYMIRREIENAKDGLPSGITVKVNSLVDPELIDLLYEASQAGVQIKLIVRGICCLIPGIPGVSENITVMSIVGQLLEHSRIFRFENGGSPRIYVGSADWMPRNLDRRIELVFPIEDEKQKARAFSILDTMLSDTTNARYMQSDTSYVHVDLRGKQKISSQLNFYHEAQERLKELQAIEKDSILIPIHSAEE